MISVLNIEYRYPIHDTGSISSFEETWEVSSH